MDKSIIKLLLLFLSLCLLISNTIQSERQNNSLSPAKEKYIYNPNVPKKIWKKVSHYFLPYHHPIKEKLDQIFSTTRATANLDALYAAGFSLTPLQGLRTIAIYHPDLPGWIIKINLDNQQSSRNDWESWINRIEGGQLIRFEIKKNRVSNLFKVPSQWIYPLPEYPSPPENLLANRKNFILIAEDMELVSHGENIAFWQEKITKKHLNALYIIVKNLGLRDCCRKSNVPWCKDGKLAFVDTESYNKPVGFPDLLRSLNPDMQNYWKDLYEHGGFAN